MGVWQMPNGGYFNLGYVSANLNYHGPRSVLEPIMCFMSISKNQLWISNILKLGASDVTCER